jgi:cyclopropane fatty-acyl-phospholipid synthase-like methyltransferase
MRINAVARTIAAVLPTPIAFVVSALSVSGIAAPQPTVKGPDIHFVATPQPVADAMLKLARVTPDDVVYDLGSGDGRIVVLAAQKYGARGVGIEIDARLVELSRQVAREGEVDDRVRFEQGDLFAADLSRATVVTLWLSETVNARLEEKLKRELRPGARVVSHQFPIGKWMPEKQIVAHGEDVYLWIIKN